MEIYLIDRETNKIKSTYTNVIKWGADFVEFTNNGLRAKIYCNAEIEYFTDIVVQGNAEQLNEELRQKENNTD